MAPSGECLRGEGLVWLVGAVVCLLAASCAAAPPSAAFVNQLPLPRLYSAPGLELLMEAALHQVNMTFT